MATSIPLDPAIEQGLDCSSEQGLADVEGFCRGGAMVACVRKCEEALG